MNNDYNHKEVARASRMGLRPLGLRWKKSKKNPTNAKYFSNQVTKKKFTLLYDELCNGEFLKCATSLPRSGKHISSILSKI